MIGWVALALSLSTAADFVIDLVFEEPNIIAEAAEDIAEKLLDVAEHLLVPSARPTTSSQDAVTILPVTDFLTHGVWLHRVASDRFPTIPSSHSPPQQASGSFSIPLRI